MAPLVSCLMVTADRVRLARRAIRCFQHQTWPNRELVVVDDGTEDYSIALGDPRIRYERVARDPSRRLGALRNLTLDLARGEYCTQWDDDEWYHPERIAQQVSALERAGPRTGICVLRDTLMHLDSPEFIERPYRTALRAGTPGTILHRRTAVRYPNVSRGEDSLFRDALKKESPLLVMDGAAHLFIRCFHGQNTWDRQHFFERLHYTWCDKLSYLAATKLRGDLFSHPAFALTAAERASAQAFLDLSRALGLLQ